MFNQPRPTFGATNPTSGFGGFGTPSTTGFGQNAFNKPATGFGATTGAFGQTTATPSLFGGATVAQQQPGAQGGLFNASTSTAFGQPQQQATTGFGTSAFGAPQQPQQQSLFGSTSLQQNTGSLFGATNQSAFGGAAAKPAGFGTFGQPQATPGGLFGQPSTSTTGAGFFTQPQTQTASLFGSTTPATNQFGGITATPGQPQQENAGSSIAKYQPTTDSDTIVVRGNQNNVSTKQHCITFMKEYNMKSLEEIRLEDYTVNRKGPTAGSSGLFGAAAPAGGIFGAQQQNTSTGLFGQPQTSTATTSLFGQTNTGGIGGTGAFGQTSAFGQQTTQASSIFGAKPFGAPATSTAGGFGGFGTQQQQQQQTNTGLTGFGAKPAFGTGTSTGLFGQSTTGGFGQPAQTGFGFGQTAQQQQPQAAQQTQQPGSLFGGGTAQTSAFGQTNTTFTGFGAATSTANTGIFGQQKPATGFGGFGTAGTTATSSAFGTGTTGFGAQPAAGGGIFGNSLAKPATGGFTGFGQTSQAAAPTLGSSFGTNTGFGGFGQTNTQKPTLFGTGNTTGGLFGNTGSTFGTGTGSTLGGFGTGGGTGFGIGNTAQPVAQQNSSNIHQQIMNLVAFPYGDNPIYKDLKPTVSEDALKPTNSAAQLASLESANKYKVSTSVTNAIKVKPLGGMMAKKSLFEGLEEYDASLEESFTLKPNPRRLILKPTKSATKPLQQSNQDASLHLSRIARSPKDDSMSFTNQIPTTKPIDHPVHPSPATSSAIDGDSRRVSWLQTAALDKAKEGRVSEPGAGMMETTMKDFVAPRAATPKSPVISPSLEQSDFQQDSTGGSESVLNESRATPHPAGIVLNRIGYYTNPPMDVLAQMVDEQGRCVVPNFTIGRTGYGNVYFDEQIDVAGLNLDEIVHFRHREVILYPDDENKPPVGEGLNRKAQITLDQVWPKDKTLHEPIKDPERLAAMDWEGKLRKICDKSDTRFLEYRPDTGSWVFKVDHFSKYGLEDSDDDGDSAPAEAKKAKPNEAVIPSATKTPMGVITVAKNAEESGPKLAKSWFFHEDISTSASPTNFNNFSQSNAILQRMEVDSHKLQAMKSSFFNDNGYDNVSVASDTSKSSSMADQIVPKWGELKSKNRFISPIALSSISENDQIDYDDDGLTSLGSLRSAGSDKMTAPGRASDQAGTKFVRALHIKPKVFTENDINVVIPMKKSVIYSTNSKINPIFFNGRKFKVGWGPYSTIQMINGAAGSDEESTRNMSISKYCLGRLDADYSANLVKSIQFPSNARISNFRQSIEAHLEIELKHDKISRDVDVECPFFEANGGTKALPEHVEVAQKLCHLGPLEEYSSSVWTLCQALWGEREELDGVDDHSHHAVMFRRDMFSEWIEDVIMDNEILRISKGTAYLDQLLDLLYSHKVADACELAMKNEDYNLSLMLAQLSGGQTTKQLMQHQLALWQDVHTDEFIDVRRLKAFMIVAGLPVLHSNQGLLNIYDDMDWIKVLAIHLWYLSSPTSSITDVLLSYEKTLETTENEKISPLPLYIRDLSISKPFKDLRHHLLHLYSRRTHALEQLLNPATHTPDPLDFRLTWFMLQFLESIGYSHCSELARSQIYTSFADQLENYGLWHWAIYILLHIRERTRREAAIKGILLRHIEIDFESEYIKLENFIVDKLGIPETWIYYAKAVRAGCQRRFDDQAKFLLHAKEWNLAHEVIVNHIAPDAILNDKIPFLKMLLKEFKDTKKVSNWQILGKILLDFIEINEAVEDLKTLSDDHIDAALDELKTKFSEICSSLKHFPCPTPKHRLCQSEIAQRIAYLMRIFYASNAADFTSRFSLLKLSLEKLPLPPEYARTELKHLLSAFLNENLRITEE